MIGDTAWLFNSDTKPFMLEAFNHDGKHEIPLTPETLAESLAEYFRIPAEKISAALKLVNTTQGSAQDEFAALSITT